MNKPRQLLEDHIVIASHNEGKIREISSLLLPLGIHCDSAKSLHLAEPEETGTTYLENALLKARAASKASGLAVIADDSGVELEAWLGRPGVDTAPYTHALGGFSAVFRLWEEDEALRAKPRVRFSCVQVLAWPDGHYESFFASEDGNLTFPPRGSNNHGYDPIFTPLGSDKTVAEMTLLEKNSCSHRARALKALIDACIRKKL